MSGNTGSETRAEPAALEEIDRLLSGIAVTGEDVIRMGLARMKIKALHEALFAAETEAARTPPQFQKEA